MKPRHNQYNGKRKLCAIVADVATLASRVSYGGNPEHKRNPGDFGLTPPAALKLLRAGIRQGLISEQHF